MNRASLSMALLVLAGCSTSTVNMTEPRRVAGSENSVRVVAEITAEEVRNGTPVPITYEISNHRDTTIAVADIVPVTSFDPDTQTITVDIGSEVPGEVLVPRLIAIRPGEKKTFTASARIAFLPQTNTIARPLQPSLRLRVSFLAGDMSRFRELMEMTEKAISDRTLADALFPVWIEQNEFIYTNALPMRWGVSRDAVNSSQPRPVRRRDPF